MNVVEFKGVWKKFTKWVLKDFNLEVEEGEVVRLEGANGSGKTTVLKLASGLERPTRGKVLVMGREPRKALMYIGYLMDKDILYPELTVRENLEFYAKIYKVPKERVDEVIDLVGLKEYEGTKVEELSFGWRRRANFARAILHKPKLLLLDEPLIGLDERARNTVVSVVGEMIKEGTTVLYTSPTGFQERFYDEERVVRLS